jgi:polyhydroxybutyrate depolymerase
MRLVLVCGLFLSILTGCDAGREPSGATSAAPAGAPAPGDHQLTIDVGGVSRAYLLHAPPGYTGDAPLPLVIAMHSYPGSGTALRDMIGMDAKADRDTALVAYPDGLNGGFNALVCCGAADDVAFLTALTRHLVDTWHADPDRVYLTGLSNGGDMSFRAAVETTGLFAAIGVVSGGYGGTRAEAADYVPKSPVSVVTIIGAQDRYFGIFQTGIAAWQQRLRCAPVSPAPAAPAPTVNRTTSRCADGSDVDVYVVTDMGHVWPRAGSGPIAGLGAPIVATDIVWDFFVAHPRRK